MIRAGIDDGSIRADIDARLTMLAILGMCNSVINWPTADQSADVGRIAAEFAKLVVRRARHATRPGIAQKAVSSGPVSM